MRKANRILIDPEIVEELYETEDTVDVNLDGASGPTWSFVTTQEGDAGRWRRGMTMIIQRSTDNKLFAVPYEVGLTESCDHNFPWKGEWGKDPETVEAFEVEPFEKTIIEYRYVTTIDTDETKSV